jgi:hypothetical protein
MEQLSFWIEEQNNGYLLTINHAAPLFYFNKADLWLCIYSLVKDVDFSSTQVEMLGIKVPNMEKLVLLYKTLT